jgi:hypothetical protein
MYACRHQLIQVECLQRLLFSHFKAPALLLKMDSSQLLAGICDLGFQSLW